MEKKASLFKMKKNYKIETKKKIKQRFIQLFIPHCTALCQIKGGGVISLKQEESLLISKIWKLKSCLRKIKMWPQIFT